MRVLAPRDTRSARTPPAIWARHAKGGHYPPQSKLKVPFSHGAQYLAAGEGRSRMHEKFDREEPVTAGSERSFGLVIGGFLTLVAFAPLLHKEPAGPRLWVIGIAILFVG